ncbi:MAG: response regulator [Chloroherpetonaceae bacterium]|nr:response regulator [Chloroherpetonaceae bacterium]
MTARILFFISAITLFAQPLFAQQRCFTYTDENGLPSVLTKNIVKDRDGITWIATDAGLVKFDGIKFTTFTDSLPSPYVKEIFKTSKGELVIVTDFGVGFIESFGNTIRYSEIASGNNVPSERGLYYPKQVFESSDNALWFSEPNAIVRFGTKSGSAEKFNRYTFDPEYQSESYSRSFSLVETEDNQLICAAWKGTFFVFDAIADKFVPMLNIDSTSSDTVSKIGKFLINQIKQSKTYGLLAATSWGVYQVIPSKDLKTVSLNRVIALDGVSSFIETASGEFYLGTWLQGVYYAKKGQVRPEKLNEIQFSVVHNIAPDDNDGIWFATDEGIALVQKTFFRPLPLRGKRVFIQSISSSNDQSVLVQDQENAYLIYSPSLDTQKVIDTTHRSYPILSSDENLLVRVIPKNPNHLLFAAAGGRNDQWMSYQDGVVEHYINGTTYRIELPKQVDELITKRMDALIVDREQGLWGIASGLDRVLRIDARHRVTEYGKSKGITSAPSVLKETKRGFLYCGASGNESYLFRFDLYSDRFINISVPLPFKPKVPLVVHDLALNEDGTVWIGTNHGLLRYKDGYVDQIELAGLLEQPTIKALLLDEKDQLWIGTQKGVLVYNQTEITPFQKQEGLPSTEVIYRGIINDDKKTIWVGTSNGLAFWQAITDSLPVTPPPRITSIVVNRNENRLDLLNNIFPSNAFLEFGFAPRILPAERALFQYRISGVQEWSLPSSETNFVLPLLPAGDYNLEVRTQQAGYQWSKPITYTFSILYPWYQRWWMFVAYVILFGITIFYIRKYNSTLADRRRFEEEQRKMVSLIEYSSECIVMMSPEEDLSFINTSGQIMLGIDSPDEMKNKKMSDFIYGKDQMLYRRMIYPTALLSGQWSGEIRFRHLKTGLDIPVQYNSFAIRDAKSDRVVAIASISSDITLRKQIEQALIDAREEALKAAQLKAEFLANMSHEIRTPMNAVIGMTGLLLETPLNHEQREYVETIRTSGDALLTIINDILDFSKIESGKLQLENYPFNLRSVVEEVLELFAVKAAEKNLDIAYIFHDNSPMRIISDATRLRQILVNLVGNAVKFTPSGEVVIEVSVEETGIIEKKSLTEQLAEGDVSEIDVTKLDASVRDELPSAEEMEKLKAEMPPKPAVKPKMRLLFKVRDTGIGISREGISRLFQSFSQVDSSTTRRYGGTGLGLAISKRLAELMGGNMWVDSEIGTGSTFSFTLLTEALPNSSEDVRMPKISLAGKKMLIVDDNATNRRILQLQANVAGMLSIEVNNGEEALEIIKRGEHFDVAILDYLMPEMDGVSLALEIRKMRSPEQLPIVMLTSIGRREENAVANSVNFAAYIYKPIKQAQLYEILENIFRKVDNQSELAVASPQQLDGNLAQRIPLRILLAEDNAVNQKLAIKLLEKMGYRADIAGNGLEVISALKRQSYDIILMDVQMPEMDGLAATRQIRALWNDYERPFIIAMTANAMQGDREMCLEAGMDDYLSKPIRVAELQASLEHWGKLRIESQKKLQIS